MFLVITVINGIVPVLLLVPQWCSFLIWDPKSTPIVFSSEEGLAAPGGIEPTEPVLPPGRQS